MDEFAEEADEARRAEVAAVGGTESGRLAGRGAPSDRCPPRGR